jgi:uncharacterized protein
MYLDCSAIFNSPGLTIPFDYALPQHYDTLPFAQPPQITGQMRNKTGVVELTGRVEVHLNVVCDRCAEPVTLTIQVSIWHTMVNTRESEKSDELILVQGERFLLDELVWEDIVLNMPTKLLCRSDCKGLCPCCGANLNESSCNCKPAGDPRWEALQELMSDI